MSEKKEEKKEELKQLIKDIRTEAREGGGDAEAGEKAAEEGDQLMVPEGSAEAPGTGEPVEEEPGEEMPGGADGGKAHIFLWALVIALSVSFAYYVWKDKGKPTPTVDVQAAAVQAEDHKFEQERRTRLLAENLPILDLDVKHLDGKVIVRGRIKNTGNMRVNDIELTLYMMDSYMTPVHQETAIASSYDGKPLKRGQNRHFKVWLDPVDGAENVVVLITGIEIEGVGKDFPLL